MGKKKTRLISMFFAVVLVFFIIHSGHASTLDARKSWSAFPILMYDTDIGVGYGGKVKLVHYLNQKESFDLTLFNSSKGERWYVFTFSIPDFEVRQGKKYPFSLDIKAEYDKFLKYYFYGIGGNSEKTKETSFTFEKKELQIKAARGLSPHFVLEAAYFLKNIQYSRVEEDKPFSEILKSVGSRFSPYISFAIRYDTSDSQIHPKRGFRFVLQNDWAAEIIGNKNARFQRFTADFRNYLTVFGTRDVLALRVLAQKVSGGEIPLFEFPVLGGGSEMNALRGCKLNRFSDKGKISFHLDYRFPVWKKIGGNLFVDSGLLFPDWSEIHSQKVVASSGWGLRYYLENFVVRFDMGWCREGMGIYFNFGHLF
jgi:outer membrane protein assembly factor BamA